jgi:hypothetical protein
MTNPSSCTLVPSIIIIGANYALTGHNPLQNTLCLNNILDVGEATWNIDCRDLMMVPSDPSSRWARCRRLRLEVVQKFLVIRKSWF